MKYVQVIRCLIALMLVSTASLNADVKLPNVFGEHMVLQRGQTIPVWGWADPNEKVSVGIAGQTKETVAGADGKWKVVLNPIESSAPLTLVVKGNNTITLGDIQMGDVWVCSGQSNMAWTVKQSKDPDKEIAAANYPKIRLLHVNRVASEKPLDDVDAKWMVCSPETVHNFTAVGYYFGRHLNQQLNVPIGLIHTAWGGTPAESWTDRKSLESDPMFAPTLETYRKAVEAYPEAQKKYETATKEWRATTQALEKGAKAPPQPREPFGENNAWAPSNLYNAMIHPLEPLAIKGAIWYQGESNAGKHAQYENLLSKMITGWRNNWNQPENHDFPFLIVQLASFVASNDPAKPSGWPELRDAQTQVATKLPNCGLAVAIDIGESKDIHPKNKQDVGKRLALVAEKQVYGRDVVASGPVFKSARANNAKVAIAFESIGGGLTKSGEKIVGFEVAGEDGSFTAAEAVIDGGTVVVWSESVAAPKAVRYGWSDDPGCNLANKEGLPAVPFKAPVESH